MTESATAKTSGRLLSLDVFRGATVAGMMMVNNPSKKPLCRFAHNMKTSGSSQSLRDKGSAKERITTKPRKVWS